MGIINQLISGGVPPHNLLGVTESWIYTQTSHFNRHIIINNWTLGYPNCLAETWRGTTGLWKLGLPRFETGWFHKVTYEKHPWYSYGKQQRHIIFNQFNRSRFILCFYGPFSDAMSKYRKYCFFTVRNKNPKLRI